jgi:hypothetical protein
VWKVNQFDIAEPKFVNGTLVVQKVGSTPSKDGIFMSNARIKQTNDKRSLMTYYFIRWAHENIDIMNNPELNKSLIQNVMLFCVSFKYHWKYGTLFQRKNNIMHVFQMCHTP